MTVEAAQFVHYLDHSIPLGNVSPKSEGDDIFRMMKTCLKNTFPNFAGQIGRFVHVNQATDYAIPAIENFTLHWMSFSGYHGIHLPAAGTMSNGWQTWLVVAGGYPQVGLRAIDNYPLPLTEMFPGYIYHAWTDNSGWVIDVSVINQHPAFKSSVDFLFGNLMAPQGTRMMLHQGWVPVGWFSEGSMNDRVIRVNSAGGGGAGGSWVISGLQLAPATLAEAHMPFIQPAIKTRSTLVGTGGLLQSINVLDATAGLVGGYIGPFGAGAAHGHGIGHDGSWRPLFADVLICQKA